MSLSPEASVLTLKASGDGQMPIARRLGDLVVADGLITLEQLAQAVAEQKRTNEKLGTVLVRLGLITEDQLIQFLSRQYHIPVATLSELSVPPEILRLVPSGVAWKHEVIPVGRTAGSLTLAVTDPTNLSALDEVAFRTGLKVVPVIATPSAIRSAIEQFYGPAPSALAALLTEATAQADEIQVLNGREAIGPIDTPELRASADQAPVIRLVNSVVADAVRRGVSDIHMEPYEMAFRVRFRTDGVLQEVMALPKQLEPAVVSRIKIMASLDIAERRLPQDGSLKLNYQSREIDLRVSILPTTFGESVCLRILDKEILKLDLTQLGFDPWSLEQFTKAIRSPYGMVLITGPTGSGKTTTLYSAIQTLNSPDINIMTVEDPVEYHLKGVNQIQVNEEIGRTFGAVLRSFLRHDPDVILVGETRDLETAQIAIRAALTGHLVFTTLHTNDCPSTVARLLDMEIHPFLVSSSLRLILAQRLIRKVCSQCKEAYEIDEETLVPYGHAPQGLGRCTLYKGKGCPTCSFTGMKGRIGIYEVMPITPEIRDLILANAPAAEIREIARRQGMKTLREAALLRVLEGITTADEVLRITSE